MNCRHPKMKHGEEEYYNPQIGWWRVSYLCIELHDVSHLVPAEAHKAAVILRTVPPHHDVGLEVGFPLHLVGRGGCPPFGKVSWCVAFSPHMVPRRRDLYLFIKVNYPPISRLTERSVIYSF